MSKIHLLKAFSSRNLSVFNADQSNFFTTNATVMRCVRQIITNASNIELTIESNGRDITDNMDYEIVQLLAYPSTYPTAVTFVQLFESYLRDYLLHGAGYILLDPQGEIVTLRNICATQVSITRSIEGYIVHYMNPYTRDTTLPLEQLLILRDGQDPQDLTSMNYCPGAVAAPYARLHNDIRNWQYAHVNNGCGVHNVVTTPNNIGDEQFQSIRQQFNDLYSGSQNAGRVAFLEGGMDLKVQAPDIKAAFEDLIIDLERTICTAYGIPYVLITPGESSFNNMKEAKLEFWESTVAPLLAKVLGTMSAFFTRVFQQNIIISYNKNKIPIIESKMDLRYKPVLEAFKSGIISKEEARNMLYLSEVQDE